MQRIPAHSTYGLLSFFFFFVADFATRTEPLRKLLAKSNAQWTPEHSQLVKEVIQRVLEGLPILNFDP